MYYLLEATHKLLNLRNRQTFTNNFDNGIQNYEETYEDNTYGIVTPNYERTYTGNNVFYNNMQTIPNYQPINNTTVPLPHMYINQNNLNFNQNTYNTVRPKYERTYTENNAFYNIQIKPTLHIQNNLNFNQTIYNEGKPNYDRKMTKSAYFLNKNQTIQNDNENNNVSYKRRPTLMKTYTEANLHVARVSKKINPIYTHRELNVKSLDYYSTYERAILEFDAATFYGLHRSLFNKQGDLRYTNKKPIILMRGNMTYFTPYEGWVRYGLNISKYGSSSGNDWIGDSGGINEWAVGFHGLRRDVKATVRGIAKTGFKIYTGGCSQWGSEQRDVGPNRHNFPDKRCGVGVFATPMLKYLDETNNTENAQLVRPIPYNDSYHVLTVLQCRIHPESIRIPRHSNNQYYIINNPKYIRPYGILVYFLENEKAYKMLSNSHFENLAAIHEYEY